MPCLLQMLDSKEEAVNCIAPSSLAAPLVRHFSRQRATAGSVLLSDGVSAFFRQSLPLSMEATS